MSARTKYGAAMVRAAQKLQIALAERRAPHRACAASLEAAASFFDLEPADQRLVEAHHAAFLRHRLAAPATAAASVDAAWQALFPDQPSPVPIEDDWRRRADCGVGS